MLVAQASGQDKESCKLEVSLEYIISSSSKKEKKRQLQKERLRRNPIFLTSHNGNQALFPSECYQRRPI